MTPRIEGLSARELAAGLQSGKWTSVDLTKHFLHRIWKLNPQVHAVPLTFADEALLQARDSDMRRRRGLPLSPLDGLPMTVKDAMRVKNMTSTYGMWIFRNYRPRTDSHLMDVLRKSGIVFLGRTAVPTGALDWNCKNAVYDECVNPFDSARSPGGSSGGAAAALALQMTPLELGSDLGGSIRYPAHCCGVYGLRTTDGWLPISDVGPEGFAGGFKQNVTIGPMARTLGDLDLLLERFADKYPLAETAPTIVPPSLKIAFSRSLLGLAPDAATAKAFEAFLEKLRRDGHTLVETSPYPDTEELYRIWGVITGYEFLSFLPKILRRSVFARLYTWWALDRRLGKGPITEHFHGGTKSSDVAYASACNKRQQVFEVVDRFFKQYHLWILPVAPSPAIPLSLSGKDVPTLEGPVSYSRYLGSYTVPTTTLGTPVLTLPIGKSGAGLPIGVQIHGPRFGDRWLIKATSNFSVSG